MNEADVRYIVPVSRQDDAAFEGDSSMEVLVGQAKDPDASGDTTGLEDQVLKADIRDKDFSLH